MTRLIGHVWLLIATRAVDEAGERINRFLATHAAINACVGSALGIGPSSIGVPGALFCELWWRLVAPNTLASAVCGG